MPELPEVETIRRGLDPLICGQKITKVEVLCDKSFVGDPAAVAGRTVRALRRFGKALIIDLSGDLSLMVHLRMTGQLIFDGAKHSANQRATKARSADDNSAEDSAAEDSAAEDLTAKRFAAGHPSENFVAALPNRQTRVILHFAHGTLYFNDQRKFGFIKVLATSAVEDDDFIRKLAKEPWDMTTAEFYDQLQRHKNSVIKAVLLDQSIIAGLGNIYADESLFMSHIHPERRAGTISRAEATELLEAARAVMTRSIESGGSTMATYVRADGTRGNYLEKFAQVFRREGQPCPRCGTEIVKTRVAGRGTHLCPTCQVLDGVGKPKKANSARAGHATRSARRKSPGVGHD